MSFWTSFFRKDAKDMFLSFNPKSSHWSVVSWNFDVKNARERRWVIDVHQDHKTTIFLDQKQVLFFKDDKLVRKRRIPTDSSELMALMNLSVHSTLKSALEDSQDFMVTPVPGATTIDMQNEARAMQWIQASFGTLYRALEKFEKDPSLILTAAFFSGTEPETQDRVLRLVVFNLDIFYYLQTDQALRILVYDDKNQGHGTAKTPSFQQIIKVTKPQFYDEIVKLVHRLAVVGEVK